MNEFDNEVIHLKEQEPKPRHHWNDDELYNAYLQGCEDECLPEPLSKAMLIAQAIHWRKMNSPISSLPYTNEQAELDIAKADLLQLATELCWEIEKLPASEQQTKCSVLASSLRQKLANPQPAP